MLACYLLFCAWVFIVVFVKGYTAGQPVTGRGLVMFLLSPLSVPLAMCAAVYFSDTAAGVYWISYAMSTLLIFLALVWIEKRDIRNLPGHCRECGYDLRVSSGRCPECAKALDLGSLH